MQTTRHPHWEQGVREPPSAVQRWLLRDQPVTGFGRCRLDETHKYLSDSGARDLGPS